MGEDFQINTYTTGDQNSGSVAVDADGAFVVVWQSEGSVGTDTDGSSVQGQRFDATGMPLGGQWQVNTYTMSNQTSRYGSSVDGRGDGSFVVVWASVGSSDTDTDAYSVQGQRFDAAGNAVGDQFQVNTYTTRQQFFASLAVEADGDFIVVWSSEGSSGSDTDDFSIQGQRFDAAGTAVGDQFQINTFTSNKQILPWVGVDADGDFVVVWESVGSPGTDTDSYSVQARRYDSTGAALGQQFQVNTYTAAAQRFPKVAVGAGGDFIVVWDSDRFSGPDTSLKSVQAQRYDAAGMPIGEEFLVNTYTTSHQRFASVAAFPRGGFVVVWESLGSSGSDTSNASVQGQRFDAQGAAQGGEFQVNTFTSSFQARPYLGANAAGDFIVVWESGGSSGTDTSGQSLQGRRYATLIFSDGFESGDTSAWQ